MMTIGTPLPPARDCLRQMMTMAGTLAIAARSDPMTGSVPESTSIGRAAILTPMLAATQTATPTATLTATPDGRVSIMAVPS
jgi:hypothetical protein